MHGVRSKPEDAVEAVVVSRVAENQWAELRAVRLAALTEAPTAFGSTLQREQGFGAERWREWTRSAWPFLTLAGEAPVGMAVGMSGVSSTAREVVAVWVDPDWRGRGVADKLVSSVVELARSEDVQQVGLWVTEDNASARRLYRRHGFVETGRRKRLPSNPEFHEEEMVLHLRAMV